MIGNKLDLYVHLVWSTWDRFPIISSEIEARLHREICCEVESRGCLVIAIGGIEDHVHLLVSFPPMICLSELMKQIKGISSRFANTELEFDGSFKWQGSYAAFTVSRWNVKKISKYIQNQKQHHASNTTIVQLEYVNPEFPNES